MNNSYDDAALAVYSEALPGYEVLGFISYVGAGIVVFAVIFCELSRSNKLVN